MDNAKKTMPFPPRLLKTTVFGSTGFGLRALATGVPAAFLARPLAPRAEVYQCADKPRAQYLILSTSSAGDPMNCNVPGTYDFPDIVHAADPRMAGTPLSLGGKPYTAAQLWSTLPPWVLDRSVFFHHATLTNNHANLAKVLRLMGSTAKSEMLPSIFAKYLAPCFGTVQVDPISAGRAICSASTGAACPTWPPPGCVTCSPGPTPRCCGCSSYATRAWTISTASSKTTGPRRRRATWTAWRCRGSRPARWGPTCWTCCPPSAATGPTARRRRRWR
jgi:hypothetical protein